MDEAIRSCQDFGPRTWCLVPLGAPVKLTRRPRTRTLTRPEADGDTGVPGTLG